SEHYHYKQSKSRTTADWETWLDYTTRACNPKNLELVEPKQKTSTPPPKSRGGRGETFSDRVNELGDFMFDVSKIDDKGKGVSKTRKKYSTPTGKYGHQNY